MQVVIRPYRDEDLDRLKELTIEAFDGVSIDRNIEAEFGRVADKDWQWRKARHIEADVLRDRAGVYVAELEGRVVGYITTWIDREAGIGNIPNLAVDGSMRGQGLGRKLISTALDHFRRLDVPLAKIETLQQNAIGQHLYPAMGFREVARQIHYVMPLAADTDHPDPPNP